MNRRLFLSFALLPVSALCMDFGQATRKPKSSLPDILEATIPKPIKLLYRTGVLLYHLYCDKKLAESLFKDFQEIYSEVGWEGLVSMKDNPIMIITAWLHLEDKSERHTKKRSLWNKWSKWAERLYDLLTKLDEKRLKELLELLNEDIILKDSQGNLVKDGNGYFILTEAKHPLFRNVWKTLSLSGPTDNKQKPTGCL